MGTYYLYHFVESCSVWGISSLFDNDIVGMGGGVKVVVLSRIRGSHGGVDDHKGREIGCRGKKNIIIVSDQQQFRVYHMFQVKYRYQY